MSRNLFSPSTKIQALVCAIVALVGGSLAAITPAMAQQTAEKEVSLDREVGTAYPGVPIEEISVTRLLGYADLNLTTRSGVATLERRLARTAQQACAELDARYLSNLYLPDSSDQDCVKSAIAEGMAQAEAAISGAGNEYSLR